MGGCWTGSTALCSCSPIRWYFFGICRCCKTYTASNALRPGKRAEGIFLLLAGIPCSGTGRGCFWIWVLPFSCAGVGTRRSGVYPVRGPGRCLWQSQRQRASPARPAGAAARRLQRPPSDYGATSVPTQKSAFRMRRFFDEVSISTFLFCSALCRGFCRRAMSVSLRSCSCPRGIRRRCGLPPASCSARRSTRCPSCFPERQLRRLPGTAHRCGPRLPRRLPA